MLLSMIKMPHSTLVNPSTYTINNAQPTHTLTFDLGYVFAINVMSISGVVDTVVYGMQYAIHYSFNNSDWVYLYAITADDEPTLRAWGKVELTNVNSQFVYIRITKTVDFGSESREVDFSNVTLFVNDLIPQSLHFEQSLSLNVGLPEFQGYQILAENIAWVFPHIITQTTGDGEGGGPIEPPTFIAKVSGNVKKLGLPFKASVVALTLDNPPSVLKNTTSDELTGDYELDVAPYTDEVLIYVCPDYGREFSASLYVTSGTIIHPSIPNKNTYIALNDGTLGSEEPTWPNEGEFESGGVTLSPQPLFRPLMNGFIKPTILPIE